MAYSSERLLVDDARQVRRTKYPLWAFFVVPLVALIVQVYLPQFQTLKFISNIELPLLVTIYFALMRRSQMRGLFIGMVLGLAQDSLFSQRIGGRWPHPWWRPGRNCSNLPCAPACGPPDRRRFAPLR